MQFIASVSTAARDEFAKDFDHAFRALDAKNGKRNFVKVYELRQALAHYSREAFDAGLKQLRLSKHYTMDSVFGANASLTEAERAAGIQEGQSLLVYVSRR
jgi:predicted negative regulator of RcsB-dependent stress response